jgi:hypothetical protein
MSNPDMAAASRTAALRQAATQRDADYGMIQRVYGVSLNSSGLTWSGVATLPTGETKDAGGMTLRTAKPGDTSRIVDILVEMHPGSRYAHLPLDKRMARSLVMQAIQRNMGDHDGGCLVVVEEVDGVVEAFIIGTLSRVYMIVDALKATDLFLVATPRASLLTARRLLGAYIAWAERNPRGLRARAHPHRRDAAVGVDGEHLFSNGLRALRPRLSPGQSGVRGQDEGGGMSGLFKSIGKIFKKVVKVLKKVALPALAIAAVVVTGGAALGLLPAIAGLGGLAASLGASPLIAGVLSAAGTGATLGAITGFVTTGKLSGAVRAPRPASSPGR